MKIICSKKEYRQINEMLDAINDKMKLKFVPGTIKEKVYGKEAEFEIDEKYLLIMLKETNNWLPAIKSSAEAIIKLFEGLYNGLIERERAYRDAHIETNKTE